MDKMYAELMDEIAADELYEDLLAYGFFAEKIPPVFTAVPFFDYCKRISFSDGWNEYITFQVMRNISIPRLMGTLDTVFTRSVNFSFIAALFNCMMLPDMVLTMSGSME